MSVVNPIFSLVNNRLTPAADRVRNFKNRYRITNHLPYSQSSMTLYNIFHDLDWQFKRKTPLHYSTAFVLYTMDISGIELIYIIIYAGGTSFSKHTFLSHHIPFYETSLFTTGCFHTLIKRPCKTFSKSWPHRTLPSAH